VNSLIAVLIIIAGWVLGVWAFVIIPLQIYAGVDWKTNPFKAIEKQWDEDRKRYKD